MKSILAKRWKMTSEIHFVINIYCIEPKFTNVFLANVLFSRWPTSDYTSPETLGEKLKPRLSPGFILYEKSVAQGSAALPQHNHTLSFLPPLPSFSSFVILPPCILTTSEKWPAEIKIIVLSLSVKHSRWNKCWSLLFPKAH